VPNQDGAGEDQGRRRDEKPESQRGERDDQVVGEVVDDSADPRSGDTSVDSPRA
jgi:hypothetical protein